MICTSLFKGERTTKTCKTTTYFILRTTRTRKRKRQESFLSKEKKKRKTHLIDYHRVIYHKISERNITKAIYSLITIKSKYTMRQTFHDDDNPIDFAIEDDIDRLPFVKAFGFCCRQLLDINSSNGRVSFCGPNNYSLILTSENSNQLSFFLSLPFLS